MKQIDDNRLMEMIRIAIQVAGDQKTFARQVGVCPSYICDVLRGRRSIGDKILDHLGLERVVSYRRIDGGSL